MMASKEDVVAMINIDDNGKRKHIKTEGLTATGRQKILAVIIDNKIMSKSEIISYIDFFISQRSSNSRMEVAISKWEADREFVENYKIGQYTQYGVNAIYRR